MRNGLQGPAREMGSRPVHIVGPVRAREKARECRRRRHERTDPIDVRKTRQAEQLTLSDVGSPRGFTP